jgi:hypothetical protein
MDELMQRLKGIGLDDGKAGEVIETVKGFLKEKMPEPIASKLDDIMSGDVSSLSSLTDSIPGGDAAKGLGDKVKGLLGS